MQGIDGSGIVVEVAVADGERAPGGCLLVDVTVFGEEREGALGEIAGNEAVGDIVGVEELQGRLVLAEIATAVAYDMFGYRLHGVCLPIDEPLGGCECVALDETVIFGMQNLFFRPLCEYAAGTDVVQVGYIKGSVLLRHCHAVQGIEMADGFVGLADIIFIH